MKKLLPLFIAMSFVGLSANSYAEDLLQVYQNPKKVTLSSENHLLNVIKLLKNQSST